MMATKSIGKVFQLIFFIVLVTLTAGTANAAIIVTLDRQQITIDDTFTLTIRVTAGEDLDTIDLTPLNTNFDILGRSQNSRHIFGSAGNESWSELALSLAPKYTGTLYIPALSIGSQKTQATEIIVRESTPLPAGSLESIFLEVETDKDTIFVQEQLIFTVRIYQSINLENPSISELKIDNSFVEQISQSSGQRRLNNKPYLVHEIKYAIFPQKSGALSIPSLTFSGTQLNRRRSLFDMGGQGKLYRKQSDIKTIEVKPIPPANKAENWLPAEQLTIEENWSTPPENLVIGESTTRTLTIKAKGLLSEQLPPLLPPDIEGIKFYPDQPTLENQENELGISSTRIESSAMVITQEGDFTIPEIKLAWWDSSQHKQRWVSIPSRHINIVGTAVNETLTSTPLSINKNVIDPMIAIEPLSQRQYSLWIWKMIAGVATFAWLLTSLVLIKTKFQSRLASKEKVSEKDLSEKRLYKKLIKSCGNDKSNEQRTAIIDWAQTYWQSPGITTLTEVADKIDNNDIKALLADLDASLYSSNENKWDSKNFIDLLNHYKSKIQTTGQSQSSKLQKLYSVPD